MNQLEQLEQHDPGQHGPFDDPADMLEGIAQALSYYATALVTARVQRLDTAKVMKEQSAAIGAVAEQLRGKPKRRKR